MKKVFVCFLIGISVCRNVVAQWRDLADKNDYSAGLKIGDQMPDIPLGDVVNNHTGKTRFSDFKGKLVILDFWNTGCASCIAAFPKMEKLQHEFEGKIQVFIVNPWESQAQIEKMLGIMYGRGKVKLPNLPSIVNAVELNKLFPVNRGVPHHVWIDEKGMVRIRGHALNTYPEKINDLFEGKEIMNFNDANTTPWFDTNTPYYKMMGWQEYPMVELGSFFTKYNNQYATINGSYVENKIDSALHTIRSTYVNQEVLELYKSVFTEIMEKNFEKVIYSANRESSFFWGDYFILSIKDTLKYTSGFRSMLGLTDDEFTKSRFCYEQIVPESMPKEIRRDCMLKDLNRYFGNLYGISAKTETRKTSCFVLIRTSNKNKLSAKAGKYDSENFIKDGKKMIRYTNYTLGGGTGTNVFMRIFADLYKRAGNGMPLFLLDETGIKNRVDIVLPAPNEIKNIEALREALKPYDLDIIPAERDMDFVVIREEG